MAEGFPAEWVDAIFARLSLAYGVRFTAQWEGLNPEHVKASWRRELQGVTSGGVAYALAHLPGDYPPNVMQFRGLCHSLPERPQRTRLLEGPGPTQASIERLQRAVAPLKAPKDPKAWAWALKAREERGDRLTQAQRTMWRAALSSSAGNMQASNGAASSPVATDSLSPSLP